MKNKVIVFHSRQTIPEDELEHVVDAHLPLPLRNRVELLDSGKTTFTQKDDEDDIEIKVTIEDE
jgi:hypothetical protein